MIPFTTAGRRATTGIPASAACEAQAMEDAVAINLDEHETSQGNIL